MKKEKINHRLCVKTKLTNGDRCTKTRKKKGKQKFIINAVKFMNKDL